MIAILAMICIGYNTNIKFNGKSAMNKAMPTFSNIQHNTSIIAIILSFV